MRTLVSVGGLLLLLLVTACSQTVPPQPPSRLQSLNGAGLYRLLNDSIRSEATIYFRRGDSAQVAHGRWEANGGQWTFVPAQRALRDSIRWKVGDLSMLPKLDGKVPLLGHLYVTANADSYWPTRMAGVKVEVIDRKGQVHASAVTDEEGKAELYYPLYADMLDTPEQLTAAIANYRSGYRERTEGQLVMMMLNPGAQSRILGPFRVRLQGTHTPQELPLPEAPANRLSLFQDSHLAAASIQSATLKPLGRDIYRLTIDGREMQMRAIRR